MITFKNGSSYKFQSPRGEGVVQTGVLEGDVKPD